MRRATRALHFKIIRDLNLRGIFAELRPEDLSGMNLWRRAIDQNLMALAVWTSDFHQTANMSVVVVCPTRAAELVTFCSIAMISLFE